MKITDANTTVLFQEISDEESSTIGGGISGKQLSTNLSLAAGAVGGASLLAPYFGPIGVGVGVGLRVTAIGLGALATVAGTYSGGNSSIDFGNGEGWGGGASNTHYSIEEK